MGMNTPDDQQRAHQPDVFWRRRVIALAAGIAVVGLLAWAVNGVVGTGDVNRQVARGSHPASGAALAGTPTASQGTPSSAAASAQPSASAGTPTPARSPRPGRKTVTTAHTGSGCPPGDVVISLMASQDSYPAQVLPQFQVAIVSTAPRSCTFDVGAKSMQLVIRSGPARVWGSADCMASARPQVTNLARGVPTVLHVSWDRKTSVPGCQLVRSAAGPGTYTATAGSGGLSSNTLVFVLRGAGVAMP
jgi:hypothetical protein